VPPPAQSRLSSAFRELGRRIDAARLDTLIVVSPDHWVNFFIDNLPAFCLGVGAEHAGPPEPFLRDFPHKTMAGDPDFAGHLHRAALARDFDPAASHRLTLDHGFCIPLWRAELKRLPRIVPMIVNDLEPPMPSVRRCIAWGALIAEAVASYPAPIRVGVLGTGGLSHSIGEPTMGEIDEAFDRVCIEGFRGLPDGRLAEALEAALATTGNGGHEVRNWAVAHGAAGGRGFDLIDYLPVPEVYVGCGFATWRSR
jgi:aromatic ring-opening dioxygenase catalytic subunit (LigB family)